MGAKAPRLSSRALDISDDAWLEAVRRAEKVRSLATGGTCGRAIIKAAADTLGLTLHRFIG